MRRGRPEGSSLQPFIYHTRKALADALVASEDRGNRGASAGVLQAEQLGRRICRNSHGKSKWTGNGVVFRVFTRKGLVFVWRKNRLSRVIGRQRVAQHQQLQVRHAAVVWRTIQRALYRRVHVATVPNAIQSNGTDPKMLSVVVLVSRPTVHPAVVLLVMAGITSFPSVANALLVGITYTPASALNATGKLTLLDVEGDPLAGAESLPDWM